LTAAIALEEEAGTIAIGVDHSREVIALLPGYANGVGEVVPGSEAFRWRLDDITQGSRPKLGEPIRILAGEDDLN
jgi:hypothetical protein